VFIVYGLYLFLVIKTKEKEKYLDLIDKILKRPNRSQYLPSVTVLTPAYNEETGMLEKLRNVANLDYSSEKIEVLIVDDCSIDRTSHVAKLALKKFGLRGRIIRNEKRVGQSASFNRGIREARSDLILLTDADIKLERGSLKKGVKIITALNHVGVVVARTSICSGENVPTTQIEKIYRGFWDQMCTSESALHSTFPGGTGFALLRKSSFRPVAENCGSFDGNNSLLTVKRGFRYIYVPNIVFYEVIPSQLEQHGIQKVRRASMLLQTVFMNMDVLFNRKYGKFGTIIFPLRFAMLVICPPVLWTGLVLALILALTISPIVFSALIFAALLTLLVGVKKNIEVCVTLTSFALHQLYLLFGLIYSTKKKGSWRKIKTSTY
jgi:glycosyltransferase involved in cell wall biosynthesis